MENLSWKADDIKLDFKDCKNLGDLVKEIESRQSSQGHVICQITVNGMSLDEFDEQRFSMSMIEEIKTLDIQYTAVRKLIAETESSTMSYAKSLVSSSLKASELFRSTNLNEAHKLFKTFVESLDSLMQANQLILNVRSQEGLTVSTQHVELDRKFVLLLNDIFNAYEKRDFILTADILEYDLTQALLELSNIFKESLGDRTDRENNSMD